MAKRPKPPTRAERLAAEAKQLELTLKRSGVLRNRANKLRGARPAFPDLDVSKAGLAPMSQAVSPNGFRRSKTIAVPAGFHIGTPHKQGMQLMPNREVEWSSGKKS